MSLFVKHSVHELAGLPLLPLWGLTAATGHQGDVQVCIQVYTCDCAPTAGSP